MYATEKSLFSAAHTNANAAALTAAHVAIPARRAVSPRRSLGIPTACQRSAIVPANRQYALRTRAKIRAKLPNRGMDPGGTYRSKECSGSHNSTCISAGCEGKLPSKGINLKELYEGSISELAPTESRKGLAMLWRQCDIDAR